MNSNQTEKNSYESLKSDIKGTATGLFFVGGLIFLVILILSIIVAVKNSNLDIGLKSIIIFVLLIVLGLITFNQKARTSILGAWLIILVAAIVLPMFALAFYLFYIGFTSK